MPDRHVIRTSLPADLTAIGDLYRDAFPEEDLVPLVTDLLTDQQSVLSLVATCGSSLVGHVMFTECRVTGSGAKVALLAPLAVGTNCQKKGFGSALVGDGLQRLKRDGVSRVYVLGDPRYYRRFGFVADDDVAPPYPLPAEWEGAWQSIGLDGATDTPCGVLVVPGPWQRRALWMP